MAQIEGIGFQKSPHKSRNKHIAVARGLYKPCLGSESLCHMLQSTPAGDWMMFNV